MSNFSKAIAYFPNFPHVLQSLSDIIVFESNKSITHENINSKSENKIYDFFINDIKNDKGKKILSEFEMLTKLDELYEKADRMPVWLFDTQTLTKFGSLLGAIIASFWLNWLFGKMVQM